MTIRQGVSLVGLSLLLLAGCGDDEDDSTARPATESSTSIEVEITEACGTNRPVDLSMATEKVGYGSRTDYFLVLCEDGSVHRVEVS